MPALSALLFRMSKSSREPVSAIARFRRRFPRSPRSMFLIFRSSTTMKSWVLTIRFAKAKDILPPRLRGPLMGPRECCRFLPAAS